MLGLIFILLLSGQHAARVEEKLRILAEPAVHERYHLNAAAQREERRRNEGVTAESLVEEVANVNLRSSETEFEIMRGRLAYHKYSKRDVSCWTGCYKPAFMIVRKEKMQMNHVFVDLHYDLDEASFVSGSPVSSKPDHVIELYPDSFVGVQAVMHEGMPGLKMHGAVDGSIKMSSFTLINDRMAVKRSDGKEWISYSGRPMELAMLWMQLLKTVQAVGTSMTEGTSLVQCSYVPTDDACSSPDFCTLVRGDRPKCFPKVGKNQNLEAWQRFSARAAERTAEVKKRGCVNSCKKVWKQSSQDLTLAKTLAEKAKPMLEMGPALPKGMVEVAQEILKTSKSLQETMVNDLSETFDAVRAKRFSVLGLGLKRKNCENLEKGAMSAVVRLSLDLGDQSDDAHEDRRQEFEKFANQCPWLRTLAGDIQSEAEITKAAESEDEAEEVDEEKMEKLETMSSSGDSLLEQKDSVDPVTVASISAIVCAVLIVAGILLILLGGLFCKFGVWLSNTKSDTAEDLCRKQHKVDTCYSSINTFGCVLIIGGFIALIICAIALMASGGGGGGMGSGDVVVAGHGGPTYYAGPGLYWWYMPPMYIHTGSGGYYGRGNFLTDEEKANFDYNKCLEVRGKLPKKLSRPKKLPKRGSGPNEQQREQRRGSSQRL